MKAAKGADQELDRDFLVSFNVQRELHESKSPSIDILEFLIPRVVVQGVVDEVLALGHLKPLALDTLALDTCW